MLDWNIGLQLQFILKDPASHVVRSAGMCFVWKTAAGFGHYVMHAASTTTQGCNGIMHMNGP